MYLNQIKLDQTKIDEGIWYTIDDVSSVKVARLNNSKYTKRTEELTAKYRRGAKLGNITTEQAKEIIVTVMSETVLVDWKGFLNDDGSEIPYSVETAAIILKDPECANIFELVHEIASSDDHYRKEGISSTVKKVTEYLSWEKEWGKSLKFLQEIADSSGVEPQALQKRPQLDPEDLYIVEVFKFLFRGESMSLDDLIQYCNVFGVWDVQRFIRILKEVEYFAMLDSQESMKSKSGRRSKGKK